MGIGVGVLVLKDNKILLGKRNDDANKASSLLHGEGTWTMPGGKVDFGENVITAAKRELYEETGINTNNLEVFCVNEEILPDVHFVTLGLILKECEQSPETKEPIEITEWKWFDMDNLPVNIYPPSKKILNNYKQNKFFIQNNN